MPLGAWEPPSGIFYGTCIIRWKNRAGTVLCPYRKVERDTLHLSKAFDSAFGRLFFLYLVFTHCAWGQAALIYLSRISSEKPYWTELVFTSLAEGAFDAMMFWRKSFKNHFHILSKEWSRNMSSFRRILYLQHYIRSWTFHWWSWIIYIQGKWVNYFMCWRKKN